MIAATALLLVEESINKIKHFFLFDGFLFLHPATIG
jgi:hypothetical protein